MTHRWVVEGVFYSDPIPNRIGRVNRAFNLGERHLIGPKVTPALDRQDFLSFFIECWLNLFDSMSMCGHSGCRSFVSPPCLGSWLLYLWSLHFFFKLLLTLLINLFLFIFIFFFFISSYNLHLLNIFLRIQSDNILTKKLWLFIINFFITFLHK